MSNYLYLMGWNEIITRIFDGFERQQNVSPPWLVNPSTHRRLKLDVLYPEVGIAMRFTGLQARGAGRKSDWEELEDASRDEIRQELCRLNGVELLLITPYDPYPAQYLKRLHMLLGATSRDIAKRRNFTGKAALMERLTLARKRLDDIRKRVSTVDDLIPYAELWRDRETREIAQIDQASSTMTNGKNHKNGHNPAFKIAQQVQHVRYGRGAVTNVESRDGDTYVTVNFVTEGERVFMASLLADKMRIVP